LEMLSGAVEQTIAQWGSFALLLPRIGGIMLVAPVFGGRYLPYLKVGITAALALVLVPVVAAPEIPAQPLAAVGMIAGEFVLGVAIGYVCQLFFVAVQVAGQLIDWEMGFGIVNVVDPLYGTQVPLVGNFLYMLAVLTFLVLDGHHILIRALLRSYELLPPGWSCGGLFESGFADFLTRTFGYMFLTAAEISVPVLGVLFLTSVALGVVARTVPQMNVFVIGLPVKIIVGTVILVVMMPMYGYVVRRLVDAMGDGLSEAVLILSR